MKRIIFFLSLIILVSASANAQGNSQAKNKDKGNTPGNVTNDKGKDKDKNKDKDKEAKDKAEKQKHEKTIWEGTSTPGGGGPTPSKNQPAKVRASFQRDYPNASQVSWSKYRGDWTATFRNGFYWSTAVYHANGNRRDTRTEVPRTELPRKIEDIFKKKPEEKVGEVVKIDLPDKVKKVFRIKTVEVDGKTQYKFYGDDGAEVQYKY